MPTGEEIKSELKAQLSRASKQGRQYVEINAGELHRVVGGYPQENRMPMCCACMRAEMKGGDREIFAPPRGDGASLTIRYLLPREIRDASKK